MFKKLVLIGFLLAETISFAGDWGNRPSVSVGIGSIGSEMGYGVFLGSPYFFNGRTNIQVGFRGNQLRGVPNGGILQRSYDYSLLDVTVLNRFYSSDTVKANFGVTSLIGLPSDLNFSTASAIKYSLGAEYQPPEFFATLFSEVGVSWGLPIFSCTTACCWTASFWSSC